MKKTILLAAAGIILFAQCTSKKATTKAPDATAGTVEVKKVYTDAEKQEGMVIAKDNCAKCHKLFAAGDLTVAEWERILPSMNRKAKLTPEQAGKVHAYLTSNAKPM